MLFPKVCGVDLGTDTIKIKDRSGKKFLYDKNVVALRNDRDVIAVGNDAYEIFEKNPQNVQVIWPMSGGVIANLTEMEIVLSSLLKHFSGAFGSDASFIYSSTERNHTGGAQSIFPRHERKDQRRQNPADR